jgi:predicted metal-dependent phosphotriesterase family hydrolase
MGLGRDVEFARMLSRYSGVQIVVPTGFWASAGPPRSQASGAGH